jgi:hypothetical protein
MRRVSLRNDREHFHSDYCECLDFSWGRLTSPPLISTCIFCLAESTRCSETSLQKLQLLVMVWKSHLVLFTAF